MITRKQISAPTPELPVKQTVSSPPRQISIATDDEDSSDNQSESESDSESNSESEWYPSDSGLGGTKNSEEQNISSSEEPSSAGAPVNTKRKREDSGEIEDLLI